VWWRWNDSIEELRAALRRGEVLAIPTESTYGLAVDPRSVEGVAGVYALKGRDAGKALPVVAASLEQLADLGVDPADPLVAAASTLWPAPLSVVARCRRGLPAAAGDDTLAVRVPAHPQLRALLARLGHPLTATSANPSGGAGITDPRRLVRWLETRRRGGVVVDGGVLPGGPPSTLVAGGENGPRVLRVGSFPPDAVLRLLAAPRASAAPAPAVVAAEHSG
jgi:L-threonylcarbamoyladenylate synthase